MYTGRMACCPLVSHAEYAPRALLSLKGRDRQTGEETDGHHSHQTITLRLPLNAAGVKIIPHTYNAFRTLCAGQPLISGPHTGRHLHIEFVQVTTPMAYGANYKSKTLRWCEH